VVVFAVYPFAAEMFRQGGIPKRLIPGTIALGAFSFTMDSLPGTPQIQNVIPTTFFKTNIYAAPTLGVIGSIFIFIAGMAYLEWRRRTAMAAGEGYGTELVNEPEPFDDKEKLANPVLAILPLVLVGVTNKLFTDLIPQIYGKSHSFVPAVIGKAAPVVQDVSKIAAIWAVEGCAAGGHPDGDGVCLAHGRHALRGGHQGRRWGCPAGLHEHGLRVWLRCRDCRPARLSGGGRCPQGDSQSAGQ
jgi:H+/gluconate symporter-like permease